MRRYSHSFFSIEHSQVQRLADILSPVLCRHEGVVEVELDGDVRAVDIPNLRLDGVEIVRGRVFGVELLDLGRRLNLVNMVCTIDQG